MASESLHQRPVSDYGILYFTIQFLTSSFLDSRILVLSFFTYSRILVFSVSRFSFLILLLVSFLI